MTIVAMRRVSVAGRLADKEAILEGLQALGILHCVPLREPDPLAPIDAAGRRRAQTAYRHLVESPEQRRQYRPGTEFDSEAVFARITANRLQLRALADRRDLLTEWIGGVTPWGNIELPPLEQLGGHRLWFYVLPVKERSALEAVTLPWAIVSRDATQLYVVLVAPEAPPAEVLPVARTRFGATPLHRLQDELEEVEIAIEKAETERGELTRWSKLLRLDLAAAEDRDLRRDIAGQTLDMGPVFAIQGWAPVDSLPAIEHLVAERGVAAVIDPPGPEDRPPTLLRSGDPRLDGGGDLTNFYSSPSYRSWDPSLIVFFSFAIFFAMILADAGYAVLIGVIVAWFWKRMGGTDGGQRIRVLLAVIAVASFVYGVLAGSYFGVEPPKGSWIARLAIVHVTNFDEMMRLSVLIGAVHVGIALAMSAWIQRGSSEMYVPIGWIIVILGGLLLWLGKNDLKTAGAALLVLGLAVVFSGKAAARPIQKPMDWLLRASDGLMGLTSITKLFGDILSYLRLFALGLASASLATTFNNMAAGIELSRPGLGLLLSILILLVGHTINFVIGIMGGVVHGLRLNYIEFFGWGLPEEGYPFRAFAKREISE